jgi:hypothetical protein
MNIPGFTAEASAYAPHNRYRTARLGWGVSKAVMLAAVRRPNCYRNCLSSCEDDPYYCEVNCQCYCLGGPPLCQYQ